MVEEIPWEDIYQKVVKGKIPWESDVPKELVGLLNSGRVKPCRAADIGCGTGHHAIYLAKSGFKVTGIDIAPTALSRARENAQDAGVEIDFLEKDIIDGVDGLESAFDFVFDWKLLHHFHPEQIDSYMANVKKMMKPGAKYFTVSFSDKDSMHPGHHFKSRLGTIFYMHSIDELAIHLDKHFKIEELRTARIGSTFSPRFVNYALMQRE